MLITIVEFKTSVKNRAVAMAALSAEGNAVRAMSGCIAFRPFADPETGDTCFILHEWENENDFSTYVSSDHFAAIGKVLRPLMTAPPISRRFRAELLETVA